MNILDIGIILLLLMFLIVGSKTGVIKELISLVSIIIIFIISYSLKGILGNILCIILPFFKFSGAIEGLVTLNILLYQLIAFIIIFSILLGIYRVTLKLSSVMQKIVNMTIILIIPSKILGAVISFIKGYVIIFIALLVLYIPFGSTQIFATSKLVDNIIYNTPILSNSISKYTSSIKEIYVMSKDIKKKKITINEANLKSLDIMLKHKIVSKKTINKLVSIHKLDDIENINTVLNRY